MYFKKYFWRGLQGAGIACSLSFMQGIAAQELSDHSARQPALPSVNLHYQSPLVGYQRYSESSIQSWQQSNRTVHDIGGWKSYAKEVQSPPVTPAEAAAQHPMPMGHSHGGHK